MLSLGLPLTDNEFKKVYRYFLHNIQTHNRHEVESGLVDLQMPNLVWVTKCTTCKTIIGIAMATRKVGERLGANERPT